MISSAYTDECRGFWIDADILGVYVSATIQPVNGIGKWLRGRLSHFGTSSECSTRNFGETQVPKMKLKVKGTRRGYAFWICLATSIILGVCGFLAPPLGVIHNSVLYFIGLLFLFASLAQIPAIVEAGHTAKITHGDTSILIGNGNPVEENL